MHFTTRIYTCLQSLNSNLEGFDLSGSSLPDKNITIGEFCKTVALKLFPSCQFITNGNVLVSPIMLYGTREENKFYTIETSPYYAVFGWLVDLTYLSTLTVKISQNSNIADGYVRAFGISNSISADNGAGFIKSKTISNGIQTIDVNDLVGTYYVVFEYITASAGTKASITIEDCYIS